MPINKNAPAYPHTDSHENGAPCTPAALGGLTKREHIAAMCLQGLLAHGSFDMIAEGELAKDSCKLADALLTHLENT